jgi:hypothetical protein
MPLFMDIHEHIDGLTPQALADAHKKDLEVGRSRGVTYLNYWYNEKSGKVFCLVEAPSREAAIAVHHDAHGLVADHVIEVKQDH